MFLAEFTVSRIFCCAALVVEDSRHRINLGVEGAFRHKFHFPFIVLASCDTTSSTCRTLSMSSARLDAGVLR